MSDNKKKTTEKFQVQTPAELVTEMLNEIGYIDNLFGKRILENSFGAGAFIIEIVRRYIENCRLHDMSDDIIRKGLAHDIFGYETDPELFDICIANLDRMLGDYGIREVEWSFFQIDFLQTTDDSLFDFVVGNPPYLSYQEMPPEIREDLKNRFSTCKQGKPDYYFAFIEHSLKALKNNGKMAYLVPGNFMKNHFSESLRRLLLDDIYKIVDYQHRQIFEERLTSSVVFAVEKGRNSPTLTYINSDEKSQLLVEKKSLHGKWSFIVPAKIDERVLFGDLFHASAPVATQRNDIFVFHPDKEDDVYWSFRNWRIEKSVSKRAAGPSAIHRGIDEFIIFPYKIGDEGIEHYQEDEFKNLFPEAYRYLLDNKSSLSERNHDKGALWYEFGRSQLLNHLNQSKILLSAFVTKKVNTYFLDKEVVPYAGICVRAKNSSEIGLAKKVLESDVFFQYVQKIGICTNSGSYRISPRDINQFLFDVSILE